MHEHMIHGGARMRAVGLRHVVFLGDLREQAAQRPAQQHDVVARVYGPRKGLFVRIEVAQHRRQQRGRRQLARGRRLGIAVELQQVREQREDEGEGDLRESWVRQGQTASFGRTLDGTAFTRSSSSEMKMTLSTPRRVAASTRAAIATAGGTGRRGKNEAQATTLTWASKIRTRERVEKRITTAGLEEAKRGKESWQLPTPPVS